MLEMIFKRLLWYRLFYPIRRLSQKSGYIQKYEESFVRNRNVAVCKRFAKKHPIFRPWFLRYIPKDGYPIGISYVDTNPDSINDDSIKTILLLHGTPGSYYDFFRFIAQFGKEYRIIAPNFPDFIHTKRTGCFWHSAEEKSEFIADFLKDLNIKNIHCLVAHSLAAYTASYLWIYANQQDYFNLHSICLLSPVGQYLFKIRKKLSMKLITLMCRSLVLRAMVPITNKKPSPVQSLQSNYDIAIWKALTLNLSNHQNYNIRLRVLQELKIPTLFIFSSLNDKLYHPTIYYNQLYELGVNSEDFDIYEQYENNLVQSTSEEYKSWIKVVDFRSGGHYVHNTHSYLIHSYIDELLNSCIKDSTDNILSIDQSK